METKTQGFTDGKDWSDCPYCRDNERRNRRTKTVYVGSDGWPVTTTMNRPIGSFIRRLILTKKKMNYGDWLDAGHCKINFS